MHCKKNLLVLLAVLALALPLLLTGTASAKYQGDGAGYDGVNGVYVAPTDGICVQSLDINGNMVTVPAAKTGRACQAVLIDVTAALASDCTGAGAPYTCCTAAGVGATCASNNDTLANVCANPLKNTVGLKYAAPSSKTCVTIDGSGYITGSKSMENLDLTAEVCNGLGGQLANATVATLKNGAQITTATKTIANGNAAKCIAYGYNFAYQDASGTPLTFGTTGVTPQASGTGFCYTTVRTGIAAASCPSTVVGATLANNNARLGYSVSGSNCLYAYGTSGVANAALTKIDGTVYAAAGATVDLTSLTQGQCLANGATWGNGWGVVTTGATYGTGDGWTSGTGVKYDLSKHDPDSHEGCLHCHSITSQSSNGPSERFKDSQLKTGHKNMLRKVTAGSKWVGPDVNGNMQDYSLVGGATGPISWGTTGVAGSATANGLPLLYIFGDWMASAPAGLDVIVNVSGAAKYNGTSNYSCASCHTTGWGDPTGTAGVCTQSSKTTAATCVGTNPVTGLPNVWTPVTGIQAISITDYVGAEPSVAGVTFPGAGNWDVEGITCGRCHAAANPGVTAAQIAASQFPTTMLTNPGMGNLPQGPAVMSTASTALCFGCHQSMAKTSNGTGADVDLLNPENLIVKNNATAPAYTPGFSGHVLGNSFLNSVHSRATVSVMPNSLGKYDLVASGITYNSTFRGYTCWQGPTSSSPAKTQANGTEIKDKATCETLYGTGAWRSDTNGSCTTCHDVHNSMFVVGQEGLKKECQTCHVDNAGSGKDYPELTAKTAYHPTGAGTPADVDPASSCAVCHMPKPTAGDFPMHVWRINSSASYTTFPSATEFGIGATATNKNANTAIDSKGYTNAVWVDVDLACGQCHSASGLLYTSGTVTTAPLLTKAQLAVAAATMHTGDKSSMNCDACHADKRAADGTTHHAVGSLACTTCHTAALHSGILPAGGQINPTYAGGLDTPGTGCLACHGPGGLATANNIIPDGANDNHHSDHGTCTQCHGAFGGQAPNNAGTTQYGGARKYLATDGGQFCLTCHGNTGSYGKHHAVEAVVTAGMNCITCHADDAGVPGKAPAATNTACLTCHNQAAFTSTTGATVRTVTPGVNHHNGTCTTCHKAEPYAKLATGDLSTVGTVTAIAPTTLSATTYKAPGSHNPLPYWALSNNNVQTICQTCHSVSQTRSADSTTIRAIDYSSPAGKNHHNGHSGVPGTSFGGVSVANGSRGDNDPGMYCLGCHGKSNIVSGNNTIGYQLTIAASGLKTDTVGAQGNLTPPSTTGLCLGCHSDAVTQSGPTKNHHAGDCLTCHNPKNPTAMWPGIATVPATWTDCSACHSSVSINRAIMPASADVTLGTPICAKCHESSGVVSGVTVTNNPGVIPNVQVACGQCHMGGSASNQSLADLTNWAVSIHGSAPMAVFSWSTSTTTDYKVNYDASLSGCPTGNLNDCTFSWSTGETGAVTSHTFTSAAQTTVTLTVTYSGSSATSSAAVTPKYVGSNPTTVVINSAPVSGYGVTANYTLSGGNAPYTVRTTWGDGNIDNSTGVAAGANTATHNYLNPGTYTVTIGATDTAGNGTYVTTMSKTTTVTIQASTLTVSGSVTKANGTPVGSASVNLKLNGVTKKLVYTAADGTFTITGVAPGTYTATAAKSGLTFPTPATVAVTTTNVTGVTITSTQ